MDENNINTFTEAQTPVENTQSTPMMDAPTPVMEEPTPVIEEPEKVMEPASPIDAPIPAAPIQPVINEAPAESSIDKSSKGNKSLLLLFVVLIALLLGAVGYIVYSEFFKKPSCPVCTKCNVESATTETKEQKISFDFSKYESTATTSPIELGTIKIGKNEYKLTFDRYSCSRLENDPKYTCFGNYYTDIHITKGGTEVKDVITEYGIKTIAVLDDKYIFIDTGNIPASSGANTGTFIFLEETENTFNILDAITTNSFSKYINSFRGYSKIENGVVVDNSTVNREVGYVDKNTVRYAACEKGTTNQKYVEYLITIKDGEVTAKEDFSIDNVFCSSQKE